jgi:predicted ArsR family transcriptional regulator
MTSTPLLDWVPYVRGSDTSRDAAESMRPHVSGLEADVLSCVKFFGDATCDELEERMGLAHQTASARLKGLADKGLIKDSGARRPTRSGRAARVYVAC